MIKPHGDVREPVPPDALMGDPSFPDGYILPPLPPPDEPPPGDEAPPESGGNEPPPGDSGPPPGDSPPAGP